MQPYEPCIRQTDVTESQTKVKRTFFCFDDISFSLLSDPPVRRSVPLVLNTLSICLSSKKQNLVI